MSAAPLSDASAEGVRIVTEAGRRGLTVRLVGGAAVAERCPAARRPPLARTYKDVDLVALRRERRPLRELLEQLGYQPREEFNVLQGDRRLLYWDAANERRLDVLLDRFEMCHALELSERLALEPLTLTAADLLLTKLQVRQTNERDLKDALALVVDCEIDGDRIAAVLAGDWGWWRTATEVLDRVASYADVLDEPERERARQRVAELRRRIDAAPKTLRWKARARVGERIRWYEEPDEDY